MDREKIKYSIGLDIGTSSVGWAVVDNNFKLLKKGNKNMWGSRLFETAETAANRRKNRSTRRRYNKRRERIRLLQELMANMVLSVDPLFFIRLSQITFLDEEDKSALLNDKYKGNYNLFIEDDYNDQNFYNNFKTIYHLRNYLCQTTKKEDPRLIYLALHHIVKYRGNFLYEKQDFSLDVSRIEEDLESVLDKINEFNDLGMVFDGQTIIKILNILKENSNRSEKIDKCLKQIAIDKKNKQVFKNLFNGIVGNQFNFTKMISDEIIQYEDEDIKLKFSDVNFENKIEEYSVVLGEYFEFIELMKKIYSWITLNNILKSGNSISGAMINRYDMHHNDLKKLKRLIKEYDRKVYYEVFRNQSDKLKNYYNYINHPGKVSREEFYKYLKKVLDKINNEEVNYFLMKIEEDELLLKQNDRDNGAIPYQLNLNEMKEIIENQSKFYEDLKINKDKLISILTFKIPYYYGPLDGNDKYGWLIKYQDKKQERITPWNHDEVVDIEETASAFIERLTSFCTYLPDEPVMPKNSLTCNMYELLNELNKIRVNGKLLGKDIKTRIIEDLFMNKKIIKEKDLKKWFDTNKIYLEINEISGYQKDKMFSTSLSSWIDFKKIFGIIDDSNYLVIERVIKDITIFNEKNILKKRLKNIHKLSNEQIKAILKLNYSGWSRLSYELIKGIKTDNCYGSSVTILEVMKETNLNLMQIISDDKLGYKKIIDEKNCFETDKKFNYDEIKNLAGSPAIKKGIWQALQIIEEITKYMKHQPKNVYIEFAREEGVKKRTKTQIKKLRDIYKDLDLQSDHDIWVRNKLNQEKDYRKFSNERLYLYYTQMGKCIYSGEPIESIDDIFSDELYEVDHIVPRSIIKDDSIDNKVLVKRKENQRKSNDIIPLPIRERQIKRWKYLLDHKLISQKKYFNLIRNEMDLRTIEKFINRQLVETRQIIKHVANIIDNHYVNSSVVAIRANIIHDFRIKYNIYKNRNINDYHHGHDAYIACVIGEYMKIRYPQFNAKYAYNEYMRHGNNRHDKSGFILNSMNYESYDEDTGEIIWHPDTIKKILKCFNYRDCYITKKLESSDGELFDATIYSPKSNKKDLIPVNKLRANSNKYGGFSGVKYIIYAIEGIDKKSLVVRKIVKVPLIYKDEKPEKVISYIEKYNNYKDVKLLKVIKKNQLIEIDGGFYYITSPTELNTAWQLVLNPRENAVVYKINHALKNNVDKELDIKELDSLYLSLIDKLNNYYPKYQNTIKNKIIDLHEQFKNLSLLDAAKVIEQLLVAMSAGPQNGKIELPNFKIGDRIGRLKGQDILLDKTIFYYQSVTGLYSKKVKL
ncbi:type II CRISPR RNA-guided endonuclease Cas9 [Thomasclavelia cocleata]|uniref:type II CRISPR RNA-guided endonuclease Cas9 n=1 Tax=Thomasclavelia cocleata TaxID=69824 RepID=UPI0025776389|nr:type II CRISPR RNA-guided endonuclease Cas9 [Thomasclavelia cocleata]